MFVMEEESRIIRANKILLKAFNKIIKDGEYESITYEERELVKQLARFLVALNTGSVYYKVKPLIKFLKNNF